MGWRGWLGVSLLAVAAAVGSGLWWLRPSPTAAERGARVAARLGCFGCHGPGGTGGVANPGSKDREVPAWDGGVAMMYVEAESEIQEWILYGEPLRRRNARQTAKTPAADAGAALRMPAYEGRVSARELGDLVAYFKAVAAFAKWPEDARVRQGFGVASRLGCFGCHGPSGRVATANPGSLKGVIPAWDGSDFAELVRDDAELREWILDGSPARLRQHPIASRVMDRQVIAMPAYRDHLADGELDALVAYVHWLRQPRTD